MSLKDDLYNIMKQMKDNPQSADNNIFAQQVDAKIKEFANSRTLTVVPATLAGADTSPTGTFSGAATVKWSFAGGKVAKAITDIIQDMNEGKKSDDDLAEAFGNGLDNDKPSWTVTLSGTTTLPNGATTPSTDSGTVTSTFQKNLVITALKQSFAIMKNMIQEGQDGDSIFADALASSVTSYYSSSINSGKGSSHLAAVVFSIIVS